MATHSSILAWEIPWTEEPGMLESMGSRMHMHTHTHTHTRTHAHTHTHCTQERMSNECKTPVISKPSSGEFVALGVDCSSLISMAIKGNPEGVKKAESFWKDDHPSGGLYVAGSGVTLPEISRSLDSQGQLSVAMCKSDIIPCLSGLLPLNYLNLQLGSFIVTGFEKWESLPKLGA